MNIELNIGSDGPVIKKSPPSTANILVLGDFQGSGGSVATSVTGSGVRSMFTLDPNQLDSAIARIAPKLAMSQGSDTLEINLGSMDDFHPDALLTQDSLFDAPIQLQVPEPEPATPPAAQPEKTDESDFARLLGGSTAGEDAPTSAVRSTLDRLIADAVATDSSATPASEPAGGLTGDKTARLREILRMPDFQHLESTWRSLQWFGERIEYDESASIWLVDVNFAAFDAWSTALLQQVASGPGSAAALVVLHDFSDSDEDIKNLGELASLADKLNTVAFAGVTNAAAGLASDVDKSVALDASDFRSPGTTTWGGSPALSRVALGFPHLLLRQPFGKRSDPIDAFDFDELGSAPAHSAFLWGNASVVLALMSLTSTLVIDDALLVTYDDGSGQAIKPPTGAYMTDSAADALLARGIVPLLAQRGGTDIRIPRMQSIATTSIGS